MTRWGSLVRNQDGAVAPTVAMSLFALIAAGGIAFDYARLAALDTELQQAADQAALAAATQLDGSDGSTTRAVAAAQKLLSNETRFANDSGGIAVATGEDGSKGGKAFARVTFYTTKANAEADSSGYGAGTAADATAKFVKVEVTGREAVYAFTPIVGAFRSGIIDAAATAGMGSAICKVPPLMICNPKPGTTFDPDSYKGVGIQVTGHGNDKSGTGAANVAWGPGDFGFLDVGAGSNAELVQALAFQDLNLDCYQTDTGQVTTGNPQALYDAINTRFDLYDFAGGKGTTLGDCFNGKCPAALNTVKDVFKDDTTTTGNSCKITTNNQGWYLLSPPNDFAPIAYDPGQTDDTRLDTVIKGMGLPKDNCHYLSYSRSCANVNGTLGKANETNKIGDGKWARKDYFDTYHPSLVPTNWKTITRYETYLWELTNKNMPYGSATTVGNAKQYGKPLCSSGTITPGTDRRVLSVAVVENCSALSGSSRKVTIGAWADMFLVEPTIEGRGNGSLKDSIYMEVIGKTKGTGTASQTAQTVRRDVPYLVR
ncbi:pilus assembly protein TadG-related protein [Sphingomonas sp. BN140010]|uniref:Pilus assembly protein TadG-related protein n=1 Tax=Sphingomonas arvum TaxID=2992113 RepID=A0ABT3JDM9_9SPHN|nr:pilus assembly protein TadG-related protein [Sphingomonas sp. BN140010]MCW3797177.1 pilus assembly protein TadG-related protein [Sphingomonas sp. BN140010]